MASILSVRDVKKTFVTGKNQLNVLKSLTLDVIKGEILVIVGTSGAGKSTLLTIMGGLSRPSEGKVLIDDIDIYSLNDTQLAALRNNKMGFVFQFHHLLPEFNALENVCIPAMMSNENRKTIEERAKKLLITIGLGARLLHRPSELSGGEQQRVAMARALINDPAIIFADEPTGNLDRQNAEMMHKIMLDLNRGFGQTFVIVTHNEHLASYANRVVNIEDGIIKSIKVQR